jgi:hypothetical protein
VVGEGDGSGDPTGMGETADPPDGEVERTAAGSLDPNVHAERISRDSPQMMGLIIRVILPSSRGQGSRPQVSFPSEWAKVTDRPGELGLSAQSRG